jgi:uncharacterized protein YfkK (UPF0435 family)
MILNNAPQHEAIISNVGEIGEFRIRNSAKAFSILSSGLYANKIRAIIRELSCNAVDSHTAAGKTDVPFDVHLPNNLEPHFSIRDYGTGLSHEQVTNIYTTYFESTKTGSNDFIGALGLGSKSPFSYTDNFTVTAIKDGRKGIYTAFINEAGVPSIALMMEEQTTDPSGVEVKFSVNDRYDFDKFRQEARQVYTYFSLRPVVSGYEGFEFRNVEYETRDIIPGVHSYNDSRGSVAIMGNIAYPIQVPEAERTDENRSIYSLLSCGLEMHFGIGELDFQASREGLSYIPQTIAAIKAKLEAVNEALTQVLAVEANAIENLWDRALFLSKKRDSALWGNAVGLYAKQNPMPTFDNNTYSRLKEWSLKVDDLTSKYNIHMRGFQNTRHSSTLSNLKTKTVYADNNAKDADGHYITWQSWLVRVEEDSVFVINDTKVGVTERAKNHYRSRKPSGYNRNVYVLEPFDRTKAMDTAGFFAEICEPPAERRVMASTLDQKERVSSVNKNVTILQLEKRGGNGGRRSDDDMVWREAHKLSEFADNVTYYYVPLSGYQMISTKGYTSGRTMYDQVRSIPGLFSGTIYGVRKGDLESVKKLSNWVNFEEHIEAELNKKDVSKVLLSLVKSKLDNTDVLQYNNASILPQLENANSPYAELVNIFHKVEKFQGYAYQVETLFKVFAPNANIEPAALTLKYQKMVDEVNSRYPLLKAMSSYRVDATAVAEYVNLIDAKKGIQ